MAAFKSNDVIVLRLFSIFCQGIDECFVEVPGLGGNATTHACAAAGPV